MPKDYSLGNSLYLLIKVLLELPKHFSLSLFNQRSARTAKRFFPIRQPPLLIRVSFEWLKISSLGDCFFLLIRGLFERPKESSLEDCGFLLIRYPRKWPKDSYLGDTLFF